MSFEVKPTLFHHSVLGGDWHLHHGLRRQLSSADLGNLEVRVVVPEEGTLVVGWWAETIATISIPFPPCPTTVLTKDPYIASRPE